MSEAVAFSSQEFNPLSHEAGHLTEVPRKRAQGTTQNGSRPASFGCDTIISSWQL